MVGEIVADNKWFSNIWRSSRRIMSREPEIPVLGIMAFEISRLMSKLVNLWQSLADKQMDRLREEIANSIGIRKLVSLNEDYLMDLAFSEIIENLKSVANSVVMLGKKCADPIYHNLDQFFVSEGEIDPDWYGCRFRLNKMENKVKKMERFVAATEQLYHELEVSAELEHSLRRMRVGGDSVRVELLEFQQKVVRQHQEVNNLREMSPWVRTYDYITRLLLRSIFTIIKKINICEQKNSYSCLIRSSSLRRTSVYPSETNIFSYAFPLGRSFSSLGLGSQRSKSKSVKSHSRSRSSVFSGKHYPSKCRILRPAGFTGCMTDESGSPVVESCAVAYDASRQNATKLRDILYSSKSPTKMPFFNPKYRPLDPPVSTLGYAALALRYANIIILIEKLASSPNWISLDAKDDLYNMLPTSIRSCLRANLKTFPRSLGKAVHNAAAAFAAEWSSAVVRILEWLSPIAHNTVRWQSERNFGRQRSSFGPNVLLVQTLYFASQVETEAAIVELLVGLNYLYRFGREIIQKT
ncbi:hypothetical protein OROMI_002076 [Orobanche minor]